jgi:hypothetical protein
MKKYLSAGFSILSYIFLTLSTNAQDPNVLNVLKDMSIDSITSSLNDLTGVNQVMIDGSPYTISSRYKTSDGNAKALQYLSNRLKSYGLQPQTNVFSTTGTNIYAIQTGTEYPDKKYFISAHYDDMPSMGIAPGADDNGSGCSIVLEAARILSKYKTKYTIVYAFWDEEEQGYVGEYNFAMTAGDLLQNLQGVIDVDMVGWDGDNDKELLIQPTDHSGSVELKNKMLEIIFVYNLDIQPIVSGVGWADPMLNLFPIIGLNENDHELNPSYHTTNDNCSNLDMKYLFNNAKLAISSIAALAELDSVNTSVYDYNMDESESLILYPNPASNVLYIKSINDQQIQCNIIIFNQFGSKMLESINISEIDISLLSQGVYLCILKKGNCYLEKSFIIIR